MKLVRIGRLASYKARLLLGDRHTCLLELYEAPGEVGRCKGGWEVELQVICTAIHSVLTGAALLLFGCDVGIKLRRSCLYFSFIMLFDSSASRKTHRQHHTSRQRRRNQRG